MLDVMLKKSWPQKEDMHFPFNIPSQTAYKCNHLLTINSRTTSSPSFASIHKLKQLIFHYQIWHKFIPHDFRLNHLCKCLSPITIMLYSINSIVGLYCPPIWKIRFALKKNPYSGIHWLKWPFNAHLWVCYKVTCWLCDNN